MSKMSKSDKKLLCWLVGTLFVLILLGVIFGVSSVRESFTEGSCKDLKSEKKKAKKTYKQARKAFKDCVRDRKKEKKSKED
jgi:hypothetical protein